MSRVLHPRQHSILNALLRANGRIPSQRNLRDGLAMPLSMVNYHLRELDRRGLVRYTRGLERTYTLTPDGILAAQGYALLYILRDGEMEFAL